MLSKTIAVITNLLMVEFGFIFDDYESGRFIAERMEMRKEEF